MPPHLRSKGSPAHPAALAADKGIPPGFEEVTPQPPFASAKQQSSPRNVTQNAGTHSSRSGIQPGNIDGPVQPLIAVAQPSSSDYNGSFSLAMPSQGAPEADSADSAAAGERRHRKFRQGFAAYTAPPLLDRHGKEVIWQCAVTGQTDTYTVLLLLRSITYRPHL